MADHSRDRVEAAAKACFEHDRADTNWSATYDEMARADRDLYLTDARRAIAAADEFDAANGVVRLADDAASIERYCEMLHDAYESAAEHWGWATNPESRKPWADVPERNKMTMRMALGNLLAALGAAGVGEQQGGPGDG